MPPKRPFFMAHHPWVPELLQGTEGLLVVAVAMRDTAPVGSEEVRLLRVTAQLGLGVDPGGLGPVWKSPRILSSETQTTLVCSAARGLVSMLSVLRTDFLRFCRKLWVS